jgi:hypothetical protein
MEAAAVVSAAGDGDLETLESEVERPQPAKKIAAPDKQIEITSIVRATALFRILARMMFKERALASCASISSASTESEIQVVYSAQSLLDLPRTVRG